jgi:hypothetical protein
VTKIAKPVMAPHDLELTTAHFVEFLPKCDTLETFLTPEQELEKKICNFELI